MSKVERYDGHAYALDGITQLLEECGACHVSLQGATASQASDFCQALWRSRVQFHSIKLADLSNLEREEEDALTYSLFRQLLGDQKELKELSLRAKGRGDVGSLRGIETPLVRIDLDVVEQKEGIAALFKGFTEGSSTSLLHATLPFHLQHPKDSITFEHLTSLRSLGLRLYTKVVHPINRARRPEVDERCRTLLSNIPYSVKSLRLTGDFCGNHPIAQHLQSLPTSLKFLDISRLILPAADILTFLRSKRLHQLERLRYWDNLEYYDDYEEDEEEVGEGWSEDEREDVLRLLKKLGVQGEITWEEKEVSFVVLFALQYVHLTPSSPVALVDRSVFLVTLGRPRRLSVVVLGQ